MSYENEFEKIGGNFPQGENGTPKAFENMPETNTASESAQINTASQESNAAPQTDINDNLQTPKVLPEKEIPEYKRIDAELADTFSEGSSAWGIASGLSANSAPVSENASQNVNNSAAQERQNADVPVQPMHNVQNVNYGSYAPQSGNPAPSMQNGAMPPKAESVGIRYNADKSSNDGGYTWNYYQSGAENRNAAPETKKSRKGFVVFMAAAMVLMLIGTAVLSSAITSNFIRNNSQISEAEHAPADKPVIGQKPNGGAQQVVQVPDPALGGALTKQQIAIKCKPSSVGIEVVTTTGFYGYSYQSRGVGSGFILTEDGYIATNHHVIENADKITVQLDDGTTYDATLVGSDSITDLAVLKIEVSGLIPMEIGDSDQMVVGDSVIAIGTPAGIEFAGTVTDGIISAINRDIEITNDRGTVVKTMTLMQTNAAINPGNSGGPLINDKGEVIGINTLKLTSTYEGIGFSIPINSAVKIFNQLITDGKVSEYDNSFVTGNGAIGITEYAEVKKQQAQYYGIPEGIMVIQIQNTSSAVSAGLRRGDIIIGFCGDEVKTVDELNRLKSKYRVGDEVTLRIYRDGEGEKDITFKLDLMES